MMVQHDYQAMLSMTTAFFVYEEAKHVTGRVLDVGCGRKPYKRMFEGDFTEWVGADLRPVGEVIADAHNLPFGPEFDTVLCTSVLNYLDYPQLAVNQMAAALKPGGKLIIVAAATHEADGEVKWGFHERGLKVLTDNAGLETVTAARGGRLFSGEWDSLGNLTKWQLPVPQNVGQWLQRQDERYPLVVKIVAQKPQGDEGA